MADLQVPLGEISKMVHLDPAAFRDGRAVPMFPALVNDADGPWALWLPETPDGRLVRIHSPRFPFLPRTTPKINPQVFP
jgi:hypothetical protein